MNNFGRGFGINMTPVVKNLVIINTVMLLLSFFAERLFLTDLGDYLALYYFDSKLFMPYQIVTHMFMHGNIWHLFFNMYALVIFGNILEETWGGKRFFIYYMVTGLGAALIHTLVNFIQAKGLMANLNPADLEMIRESGRELLMSGKNYRNGDLGDLNIIYNIGTVGASGAVFGVLLAFGMLFPNIRLRLLFPPIELKSKHFVIGYGILELYLGLTRPGSHIAHFAHLGGMLFGYFLIKYYKRNQFNQNRWN